MPTLKMKNIILLICLAFTANSFSFDQCALVLEQAKNQGVKASDGLETVITKYERAVTYHSDGKQGLALATVNSSETALYQARNYFVLALFRLDHASNLCSGPQSLEVTELSEIYTKELDELDLYEEKVFELKEVLLNTRL